MVNSGSVRLEYKGQQMRPPCSYMWCTHSKIFSINSTRLAELTTGFSNVWRTPFLKLKEQSHSEDCNYPTNLFPGHSPMSEANRLILATRRGSDVWCQGLMSDVRVWCLMSGSDVWCQGLMSQAPSTKKKRNPRQPDHLLCGRSPGERLGVTNPARDYIL
jgi:hypothetical protein